ncbi:unnamed protein product [Miscanthus lutarioriparius]|uniref:Uncharacterized protein n=1 Tax=Miscanthus lutarioriparius TaxID=422564 RepID=A0A811QEE4_9POAL|nr:unnamed protein product [Miscanthus lutarioriparius]
MGPLDAAPSSAVCRAWRVLASDNGLWAFFLRLGPEPWDLVVFAETHLAAGPSSHPWCAVLRVYDSSPQLSFKQIYGLRAVVPGTLIVDGGSGYCKYGWSKYAAPSGRCATFLEFGNIEAPMYARLRHFFSTIYMRMQIKPSTQPVIVVLPLCHSDDTESARASRKQYKETLYSVLFDMNVPTVCAVDQAVLSLLLLNGPLVLLCTLDSIQLLLFPEVPTTAYLPLLSSRCSDRSLAETGDHIPSMAPGIRLAGSGEFMGGVLRAMGCIEMSITRFSFLRPEAEELAAAALVLATGGGGVARPALVGNTGNSSDVRQGVEKLCYVAADYEAELRKDTQASCEVDGEGWFTLSEERFKTPEILFQPHMGGMRAMGLHKAVALCMDHCYTSGTVGDDSWYKTVILAG